MTYSTQGLMTPMDLVDRAELHDEHPHPRCPGHPDGYCSAAQHCPAEQPIRTGEPLPTYTRLSLYLARSASGRLTPAQRRRLVKKAGKDPAYVVIRDLGMGYADPARQGMRELANSMPIPVSGMPY